MLLNDIIFMMRARYNRLLITVQNSDERGACTYVSKLDRGVVNQSPVE